MFGVSNNNHMIAVSSDLGVITLLHNRFDSVQGPRPGGPELQLMQKPEKINPFPEIPFSRAIRTHSLLPLINTKTTIQVNELLDK